MILTNTTDVHELMIDFGSWSREQPVGAYKSPLCHYEPTKTKNSTLTDDEALKVDKLLCICLKLKREVTHIVILRYVYHYRIREIAKMQNLTYYQTREYIERGLRHILLTFNQNCDLSH